MITTTNIRLAPTAIHFASRDNLKISKHFIGLLFCRIPFCKIPRSNVNSCWSWPYIYERQCHHYHLMRAICYSNFVNFSFVFNKLKKNNEKKMSRTDGMVCFVCLFGHNENNIENQDISPFTMVHVM